MAAQQVPPLERPQCKQPVCSKHSSCTMLVTHLQPQDEVSCLNHVREARGCARLHQHQHAPAPGVWGHAWGSRIGRGGSRKTGGMGRGGGMAGTHVGRHQHAYAPEGSGA